MNPVPSSSLCLAFLAAFAVPAVGQKTTLVSVNTAGVQGDLHSYSPAISADGRYVAFYSEADNLVAGDTNGVGDLFLRDRRNATTTLVSVDWTGGKANGNSEYPSLSADARYATFFSYATDLVATDTNGFSDVFVRDLVSGTNALVSVDSAGVQGNASSLSPVISADGRYVVFTSYASNLVAGDTNDAADIFRRDLLSGVTIRVSVDSAGLQANRGATAYPSISGDGRYVTFESVSKLVAADENNTLDVYVRDIVGGTTALISIDALGLQATGGGSEAAAISEDGRYVAFYSTASNLVPGDTNGTFDAFVRDLASATTTRVSLNSNGVQGNAMSWRPVISADGRYVAIKSVATNFVPGDTNGALDVFVHDRLTGTIALVSESTTGELGNSHSSQPAISAHGEDVAFYSNASNLVPDDKNWSWDVFVHSSAKIRRR